MADKMNEMKKAFKNKDADKILKMLEKQGVEVSERQRNILRAQARQGALNTMGSYKRKDGGFIATGCGKVMGNRRKKTRIF